MKITEETAINVLKETCFTEDEELDHIHADRLLCKVLVSLGYSELVKEFNKIPKYYA